jgi:hypothetical protein
MTVRYSSASASAAGSTGCRAYCCQAPTMVFNPRLPAEDDLSEGEARARACSLQESQLPYQRPLEVTLAGTHTLWQTFNSLSKRWSQPFRHRAGPALLSGS